MRTIDLELGPAHIVSTREDACALWDWLTPYRLRGDHLGWDGETVGLTSELTPWHPDFRLRTAQMSDGVVSWVVQAEKPDMLDVVRECTRAHPKWVAHYAENDIRFAERGAPGSIRLDSVDAHFSCSQPVLAWYDPRTVTSHDVFDPNGRPIWLNSGLKQSACRLLGTDVLNAAEQALHTRFHAIAPPRPYTTKTGKTAYRAMGVKDAKTYGFTHIDIDDEDYLRYAALDALVELRMFHHMRKELERRGVWPAVAADIRQQWHMDLMTFRGMLADAPYAKWLMTHFQKIIDDRLPYLASHGVAPSAMGPSIGAAFERLGVRSTRTTGEGAPSWDKVMLNSIIEHADLAVTEDHKQAVELARVLTTVRQAVKFIPAYIQPMLDAALGDGRIHCSMRNVGAILSRNSAARPAVQQMPKRSSQLIRAGVIASDGWAIVSSDFKQGEPSTLAALSGDENLREDITSGDLNGKVASVTYGNSYVPADGKDASTPSYDFRQRAKAGLLGNWYGAGIPKLASSALLSVPTEEARAIQARWKGRYRKVFEYGDRVNTQPAVILASGWVAPLWDRYYVTAEGVHCGSKVSRKGLNAAAQGNQAYLLRVAVHRLIDWGWSWALMMLMHDEIIGCVPIEHAETFRAALETAMTMDFHGFPIRCDATIEGRSWMPQKQFDEEMALQLVEEVD